MAAACIKHCEVFTRPHLPTAKVVHGDRSAANPPSVLAIALAPPLSLTSTFKFYGNGLRQANLRLKSGLLQRDKGNANDQSSDTVRVKVKCEAHTRKRAELEDFSYDLYELLGVEKDARSEEIKRAYRWLQKKCHPDIAGPRGHDMAILLNAAYDVLSDPHRRANYDATCFEKAEFANYTGEPLYSKWFGPPGEDRAVFVEETRCVGCLKCALLAPNTFAIESQYGRARAVGQWLDDEETIKDAIRACPVDCISWVDRGFLPALEYIMSKQPRLLVGIDNYSYVGVRQENVFLGADRFLAKYAKRGESRTSSSQETSAQKEARMAAEEEIHMKAGRWWHDLMYRQGLTSTWNPTLTRKSQGALVPLSSVGNNKFVDNIGSDKFSFNKDADLGPLLEAAKQRRLRAGSTGSPKFQDAVEDEEYWTPMEPISCPLPLYTAEANASRTNPASSEWSFNAEKASLEGNVHAGLKNIMSTVPVLVSVIAAVLAAMDGGADIARSETGIIIASPLPASITSGVITQMCLTAAVWYMIGAVLCAGAIFITTAFVTLRVKKSRD